MEERWENGNANGALKLLTTNVQHRVLSLNEETILKLKMKHPQAVDPEPEVLLTIIIIIIIIIITIYNFYNYNCLLNIRCLLNMV